MVCIGACGKKTDPPEPTASAEPSAREVSSAIASVSASAARAPQPPRARTPDPKLYQWLSDKGAPKATETLLARFDTPPGYQRVEAETGSFARYLRTLPLAAPGTPVVSYKGEELRKGDDEYLAAVVAIDVGKIDLQQSPDVVIRLHAEWQWSKGARDMTYRGATGLDMPLFRWARGERVVAVGSGVFWLKKANPAELDHAEFRRFLDAVFTWANSTALSQQATPVEAKDVAPGDFFIHLGSPGHTLVVLDIAQKPDGSRVALFGQALNPAQNVFVLRLAGATPWFSLRPGEDVITPYTEAFTWQGLRRLSAGAPQESAP